jgi:hypothetical protein
VYYRVGRDGRRAYLIGFRDEHGRQVWKRVPGDLESAKDALADVRRKMGAGEPVRPQARTFGELADEWESIYLAKLRPSTAATYQGSLRRYVRPAFGDMPVQRIDARAVAKWVTDLQARGLKAWTIRAALTPLRRILTYAVRERLIPENPVARLGRDELPTSDAAERRVFTAEELRRLLDAATPRSRLALRTLAFTGLRASELLGLVWSDVDTGAGILRVTRQLANGERVRPKTPQAVRTVYLAPFLSRTKMAEPVGVWIEGKAATWDLDDEGESFDPAAFDAGIKAFLSGSPVLSYHHAERVVETWHGASSKIVQLGVVTDLRRESDGLYMKAWVPRPQHGGFLANVWDLIRSGAMKGLSVGGSFAKAGTRIVRAALREISVAPWGINPNASITSVTPAFEAPVLTRCGEACAVQIGSDLGKASAGAEDLNRTLGHDPIGEFSAELREVREVLTARRRTEFESARTEMRRDLARVQAWG